MALNPAWLGVGVGVVGLGVSAYAIVTGEVTIVWSRLGGWGSLSSSATRSESPVRFWGATAFYGLGGLVLIGLGLARVLGH